MRSVLSAKQYNGKSWGGLFAVGATDHFEEGAGVRDLADGSWSELLLVSHLSWCPDCRDLARAAGGPREPPPVDSPYTFERFEAWQHPGIQPPPSEAVKLLRR